MVRKQVTITFYLPILAAACVITSIFAAETAPLVSYYISERGDTGAVIMSDYENGVSSVVSHVDLSDPKFARGLQAELFDPVNNRIFFDEMLIDAPHRTHVYDIDADSMFDLPFDNYTGDPLEMLISPDSKFILAMYRYVPDQEKWSIYQYKTVVLDGKSLSQVGERIGMPLSDERFGPKWSSVSHDNKSLINVQYLQRSSDLKEHGVVVYTLPDLSPQDTIYYDDMGWQGHKWVADASLNKLLLIGDKPDSASGLQPGRYGFLLNCVTGTVESPLIALPQTSYTKYILTANAAEVIRMEKDNPSIKRYSTATGELLGEFDGPASVDHSRVTIRQDGYLYVYDVLAKTHVVIDYKNNAIVRTFNFSEY